MHGMKRAYESLLTEYLRVFPVVAILGSRQCGKTTLLKSLPPPWTTFDLENAPDYEVVGRDPALFLRLHPAKVAFDEAQLLPDLFSALRVAVDRDRDARGRFIVTGSSSPSLVREISESLAGRVGVIEMAPLTAAEAFGFVDAPLATLLNDTHLCAARLVEALSPRISLSDAHHYWWGGGYPEPFVQNTARFRQVWTQEFVRSYLERDIARLFPGLNRERFRSFLRTLAGLSGTIINHADVARTLGVSQPTARDYFEIAHGTFFWRALPAFDRDSLKRIVKHAKGYVRDSGLLHHLLRVPDLESLLSHPMMGGSWEGMVIETLLRGLNASGTDYDAFHYRTGGGAEVDLVLDGGFGLLPIEIKHSQSVDPRSLKALSAFIKEWDCKMGVVITNDERPRLLSETIAAIPFSCL